MENVKSLLERSGREVGDVTLIQEDFNHDVVNAMQSYDKLMQSYDKLMQSYNKYDMRCSHMINMIN